MKIEEFTKAGCTQCGMHEFESTGPIEHDGPTELTCSLCGAVYDREKIGNFDSLTWEQERDQNAGTTNVPPAPQTYYQDENQFKEENLKRGFTPSNQEQFIRDFEQNVDRVME
jgi:hypothetical protein